MCTSRPFACSPVKKSDTDVNSIARFLMETDRAILTHDDAPTSGDYIHAIRSEMAKKKPA